MLQLTITMDGKMDSKNVPQNSEQSNVEFYLLLIAIKLGFLSSVKILNGIVNAYKAHRNALKKKYSSEEV